MVLLSLDTVRADHLGCYGYARQTSPRLDAFAAGATRYRRSLASASWTLPTHASLFTGRYAFEHGAHGLRSTDPSRSLRPLDPAAVTLAESLRDHGYATAGFAANRPVSQDTELIPKLYEAVMPGTADAPPELVRDLVDQYDTAIANLDEEIGDLLDGLRDLGRDADTVVVVSSDHGEFFGDHRLAEHAKDVYREVLAVPLIVRSPGQKRGRVVETLVSSVDVPRLILEHCSDAEAWSGQFPLAPGNHPVLAEVYYARPKDLVNPAWGGRFDRIRTACFEWPLKLIESSDGRHELYDLDRDPREALSLFATQHDAARRLQAALDQFRSSRPRSEGDVEAKPLDENEQEELRALGYVGR